MEKSERIPGDQMDQRVQKGQGNQGVQGVQGNQGNQRVQMNQKIYKYLTPLILPFVRGDLDLRKTPPYEARLPAGREGNGEIQEDKREQGG